MRYRWNTVEEIVSENARRRWKEIQRLDAVQGEMSSGGERFCVEIDDLAPGEWWLPKILRRHPMITALMKAGSISSLLKELGMEETEETRGWVIEKLVRLRGVHDFAFWAAMHIKIKNKEGGDDVPFILSRPQCKFVEELEQQRLAGKPIRVVLLKARQWGGSTCSQIYMMWLQMTQKKGLNSLIIAHQSSGTEQIKDMYDRAMDYYPIEMMYPTGSIYDRNEVKMRGVGKSGATFKVPQRNCKISLGTAERPDSCRGGDYSLVHLSEVGLWRHTEGKRPEDIVRSACSGVLYRPGTMIVLESTANGTGNYFEREYTAARKGESQFRALFVAWWEIPMYTLPVEDYEVAARRLLTGRTQDDSGSGRRECGKYLWKLWEDGASLEGIEWYIKERAKYQDHASMASEYPSDEEEAFVNSGDNVFDLYALNRIKAGCKLPKKRGEIIIRKVNNSVKGYCVPDERPKDKNWSTEFVEEENGGLAVWEEAEVPGPGEERVLRRYLVIVDVGGRSKKADWSVILVLDRVWLLGGEGPAVVAQWRGHCDMDVLAWKAAAVAKHYDNALLVIESNTLETHDRSRQVEGDQSGYILNQIKEVYDNLYERQRSAEEIAEGAPRKYGFHTNVSTKPMVISTLVEAVREGLWTERDEGAVAEMAVYERKNNGSYGAKDGEHDDMLMTRAIGLWVCWYGMKEPTVIIPETGRVRKRSENSEAVW